VPAVATGRGRHYSPTSVLTLAARYRRRTLNEVAGSLMDRTRRLAPESTDAVRAEIEKFFADRPSPAIDRDRFLDEARRSLPRRLFEQVQRAYADGSVDALKDEFSSERRELPTAR
jgi:hypothetical protein